MAETEKPEQPQTNGLENGLDEDERSKMRPADIDADVKEMERRKRVEMIMSSKLFREELERIIELQLKDGNGPAGLLQQISDMMGIQSGKLHTTHMFRGSNCVTPINDIRGVESMGYEKGEKNLRCKLASVFRLMDLYGWSQGINNQITARLNQDEEHFLVNPHGMLFNEITASSLVKVDMQGNVVEPGTTNFSVNTQGFLLHSAIHASRPDVNCVIHIKTPSVLAVSSLKCGLLPICQEALVIGEVSQHPFVSGIFEPEEREKIIRNLGPHNKVLLLHNHGAVCCGATVEEAFYNVYNTVLACETQMKLMPMGMDNLLLVSDETRKQVYDAAHRAPDASDKKKFRVGEMEFEALIRMLDNAGFRTGYIYRHPLVKGELPKPKNDVEVPPAVSSLGYLIEQEELYKQGNWKKYVDGRNRLDRTKWLNSPNVYQKVEILETGTSDPKKITKWVDQNSEEWVAESSPTHSSTPVKIDSALQFVPKGTNPKEFKKLQQQIKENRRADKITSGPQSHILEGVSWEEAKKLQDANITHTGDQVILVGAASKGIIQRNYQHNALVYKTPYAKNPFDSMSDKEIEDYKQLVERKQRGDTDYEESQSESEAISSSRQDALRHFKSPLLSPQSATSETEEESRDEPRVLRIETKTAPRPIQAEVVLSDAEPDTTDARVERSHSARYPKAEKPESVTLMNSFRKSWSLKREKDKMKDVECTYESRNLHPNLILKECERERMASFHCCVARLKQLTHKPVIVDLGKKKLRPLLKSASDPCNLSTLSDDEDEEDDRESPRPKDFNASLSCSNIVNMSELRQRLSVRKKLLHSAKMKFLGFNKAESEGNDTPPNSPMRALISEIRETISEIMSPERSKYEDGSGDYFSSMRWIERPRFVSRSSESGLGKSSKVSLSMSFTNFNDTLVRSSETLSDFQSDFKARTPSGEDSERSDRGSCNCASHGEKSSGRASTEQDSLIDENQNEEKPVENVLTEVVKFVNASDEEGTYTITDDSCLQTYSFTETTETEWYYNKTIMTLENSQTMLEIKEIDNKEENLDLPAVKYIDTGIDTDFTEERENEVEAVEEAKEQVEQLPTEEMEADVPVCESSGLNKSSETDSSFLKSSSGRTSNDVDTSFAFKTETENSDKSPQKSTHPNRNAEEKNFLEEMLLKTKEPIEEESSDSAEAAVIKEIPQSKEEDSETCPKKLTDIPESPEFTNIDTEDAPVTSSSKDTSPEFAGTAAQLSEEEANKEAEVDPEAEKENFKPERKRKKNVKSSTKITVKKELKEKNSKEPVVSEIRLTIKNMNTCQSEKYEVKIQDVTNTSEELSRSVSSVGENMDSYESFEIMEKNCDCEAQQNLEELQSEVSSTIEKLHSIEGYFEDEIKKHSSADLEKRRNGSDELTFEYNYREFEEVLNESRDGTKAPQMNSSETPIQKRDSTEFFVSSLLGDICGEIEVCSVNNAEDGFDDLCQEFGNVPVGTSAAGTDIEDIAMSSAFVAALLSEALEESDRMSEGRTGPQDGEVVEVFCNVRELPDTGEVVEVEKCAAEVLDGIIDGLNVEEIAREETLETENDLEQECHEGNYGVDIADNLSSHVIPDSDLQEVSNEVIIYQDCQGISHEANSECDVLVNHVTTDLNQQVEDNSQGVGYQDCQLADTEADSTDLGADLSSHVILDSNHQEDIDGEGIACQDFQQTNFTEEILGNDVTCDLVTEEGIVCQEFPQTEAVSTGEITDDHVIPDSDVPAECNSEETGHQQDCQQTNEVTFSTEEIPDDSVKHVILDSGLPEQNDSGIILECNLQQEVGSGDNGQQDFPQIDFGADSPNAEEIPHQNEHVIPDSDFPTEFCSEETVETNEVTSTEEIPDDSMKNVIPDSDMPEENEPQSNPQQEVEQTNVGPDSTEGITGLQDNSELEPEDKTQDEGIGCRECPQTNEAVPAEEIAENLNEKVTLESDVAREIDSETIECQGDCRQTNIEAADTTGDITGDILSNHMPLNSNPSAEDAVGCQDWQQTETEVNTISEITGILSNPATDGIEENCQIPDAVGIETGEPVSGEPTGQVEEKVPECVSEEVRPDFVETCGVLEAEPPAERKTEELGLETAECEPEPVTEGAAELEPEPITEDAAELEPEPVTEDAAELEPEPVTEDAAELEPEPVTEGTAELEPEPPQIAQQPEERNQNDLKISEISKTFFPPPLKAITFEPQGIQTTLMDKLTPVEYILNCLLSSVTEKNKRNLTTMNDVINFIVTNEESPTNSLTEFEDMENVISASSSVVADIIDSIESQMEGDVESLPDEDELKDAERSTVERRRKKRGEPMFKVTIATPAKKEIFINYSTECSSTFNTSTELPELCNSYIKTDDVNEDFENLSSDNPEFFSVCSSGKNSLNSSFCSVEGHGEQFCCVGCEENPVKSPRSLAIIQEVDEGDSSTSSEAQLPTEFPVQ